MTTLLLLHGMGATGRAWGPLRAHLDWDGPVLAPDLAGHGGALRLPAYPLGALAAELATRVCGPVAVLGHSLGGAVALLLATGWYDVEVTAAVGVGIKAGWSDDDVARGAALAARPPTTFGSRAEALERHLKVAGLAGQPAGEHTDGVVEVAAGWQLALDPVVLAQRDPRLAALVRAAQCPVQLVRGERDAMVALGELQAAHPQARDVPGLGHNAHLEDPALLWRHVGPFLAQ